MLAGVTNGCIVNSSVQCVDIGLDDVKVAASARPRTQREPPRHTHAQPIFLPCSLAWVHLLMIPTLAWVGVTSWKVALGFIKGTYYWQLTFTDADLITLGQHSTNGTRLALAIFDAWISSLINWGFLLLLVIVGVVAFTAALELFSALCREAMQQSKHMFMALYHVVLHSVSFAGRRLVLYTVVCKTRIFNTLYRLLCTPLQTCPVCLQALSKRQFVVLQACSHTMCKACLLQHLKTQADSSRLPVCVMPHCQQAIEMQQCQKVLSQHKQVRPYPCMLGSFASSAGS